MHAPRNLIQPPPAGRLQCVAARVCARPAVIGPRAAASGITRGGELCAARRAESLTVGSFRCCQACLCDIGGHACGSPRPGVAATVGSGVPSSPLGGARPAAQVGAIGSHQTLGRSTFETMMLRATVCCLGIFSPPRLSAARSAARVGAWPPVLEPPVLEPPAASPLPCSGLGAVPPRGAPNRSL